MRKPLMFVRFKNGYPQYRLEGTFVWIAEPTAIWLYRDVQYHLVKEGTPITQFDMVEEAEHVHAS